jgi:ubiquinone/menaquinone biosynthesis C-methylase UbiE
MNDNVGQAGKPRGLVGRILGRIMVWHNRPDNEWTVGLLAASGTDRVLEVGFGPGLAIKLLSNACPSCHITGIDHSEAMIASATHNNQETIDAGRVNLGYGGVEKLEFADSSFDKAYSINCIYFWQDPLQGLRELHRVLKPTGRLAITVRDKNRMAYEPFREESLLNLLTQAGFTSVRAHHNGLASHPLICVIGVK